MSVMAHTNIYRGVPMKVGILFVMPCRNTDERSNNTKQKPLNSISWLFLMLPKKGTTK